MRKSMCLCVFYLCHSFGDAVNGDSGGSQGPSRLRIKRMLARDSSPDTFLCDTPGGSGVISSSLSINYVSMTNKPFKHLQH